MGHILDNPHFPIIASIPGYDDHQLIIDILAYSPDGRMVASGSVDKNIRLWDVRTGNELTAINGHTGAITAICFSPDSTLLASGSSDRTVRIWDISTGQSRRFWKGMKAPCEAWTLPRTVKP